MRKVGYALVLCVGVAALIALRCYRGSERDAPLWSLVVALAIGTLLIAMDVLIRRRRRRDTSARGSQ